MEIIEEQKYRFDHVEKNQPGGANVYVYQAVPRPGQRLPRESREIALTASQLPPISGGGASRQSSVAGGDDDDEDFGSEERDRVPEIVVMSARDAIEGTGSGEGASRRQSAVR